MASKQFLTAALLVVLVTSSTIARTWSDSTGRYKVDADLIARDDVSVVLQRRDKNLAIVEIQQLSKKDQEYLASEAATKEVERNDEFREWQLRNGLKFKATVVEYGRRDILIRRRRGKVYINDKRYDNILDVYQRMIPRIVTHFESVELADQRAFEKWVRDLEGRSKKYRCEGVMFELPTGDLYAVPFFLLSDEDRKSLEPGWKDWLEAEEDSQERRDYELGMRAQAIARHRNRNAAVSIAKLQLQLQAYGAGAFDLYEVTMTRPSGYPIRVVVPARDSRQATLRAKAKYPNFTPGSVAQKSRQF